MPDRPNILLILTDQHRLSAVGCCGETPCRTPNIDRLARAGVRFENAFTVCPVCSPARGTIMTGLYPHAHGICSNVHNQGCNVPELPDGPDLLSRRLEAAGYSLGYSGKWHLGTDSARHYSAPNTPCLPRDVGFEGQNFPGHGGGGFNYPEYQQYLAGNGFEHEVLDWDEKAKRIWPSGVLAGPTESTVPYFLAGNTISMVDAFRSRPKPWFIWHNFWGPHGPYYAPREYVEMYRDVEVPPWPNYEWDSRGTPGPHHAKIHPFKEKLSWEDWATAIRYYYAFTTLIDEQIGRIAAHLEATGQLENTVIVFTSDHGETLGSHGGMTDKGWGHWDETHRIPWIMRFPDGAHAGRTPPELVSLADFYPTALELAGAPPGEGKVHGRSLLPLIEGRAESWRDQVLTEFGGVNSLATTQRTLRWAGLKYGYNCCSRDELYDLEADPHETRNLIDEPRYRDRLFECRRRVAAWMRETGDKALTMFGTQACRHQPELAPEGLFREMAGKGRP